MAKHKIEDLSTERLAKRKKLATWLIWTNLIAGLLCLILAVADYIKLKELNISLFAVGMACVTIVITMYPGFKKAQEELKRRA
jgi:Na+/melibiose symporter-like transporter